MRVFKLATIRDLWMRRALSYEDKHEGTSMNPKFGTEEGGCLAHTNNLTGISASEYVCKGGRSWKILEIQNFVKLSKLEVPGQLETAWGHSMLGGEGKDGK